MAEDAGWNTRAATRASRTRRSSCGASDFVEEDVAVALEDDDNEIFGTETLSITPDGAEKSTAKRPCVSKDWEKQRKRKRKRLLALQIKVVLQVTVKRRFKCLPLSNNFLKLSRRDVMRRNISLEFLSSEYYILRGNYWRRAQLKRTASS